jgi:hypothetical protein
LNNGLTGFIDLRQNAKRGVCLSTAAFSSVGAVLLEFESRTAVRARKARLHERRFWEPRKTKNITATAMIAAIGASPTRA